MDTNTPKLDDYAVQLIKHKAWQLVGRYGFTKADREDIEQNLTVRLLRRLPQFNPARSSLHTFMDRVVERAAAHLIEYQEAPMRDYRRTACSLNERAEDDDEEEDERGNLIDQDFALCRSNDSPHVIENFYQHAPPHEELRDIGETSPSEAPPF